MSEQEKIVNCYQTMYQGMIAKDRAALFEVLDGSFVLVHMTGIRQSKGDFIQAIENGTLNYFSSVHQRIDAEAHGNQGELLGQSVVDAAVFGGGRCTWRLQMRLRLKKKDGKWKITGTKVSTF